MGLAFYDEDQAVNTGQPLRAVINGHVGGAHEEVIYIRNDDVTKWYTNLAIGVSSTLYDSLGELGPSGISWKFMYGERRPTEAEWSSLLSGEPLQLPDIGTHDLADTSTFHPVWVRVYLPGNYSANIIDNYTINLTYLPRVVGA